MCAKEIRFVMKNGLFLRTGGYSARVLPAKNSKYAVVVKKTGGINAVERNAIKRAVYELLRVIFGENMHTGAHVVLFVPVRSKNSFDIHVARDAVEILKKQLERDSLMRYNTEQ